MSKKVRKSEVAQLLIIIIIMMRRQLRSVATTPHDVHLHLHSATSVSSWPVFRYRSAVSRFFEDAQEVFYSSSPGSDRLSLQ